MASQSQSEQEKHKQRIIGVFNRAAPRYDQLSPHFFSHLGHQLVKLANLQPGSRVLDIACGRGAVLFAAAQQVGPQGELVGIDLAEQMVQQTRAAIQANQLLNVHVEQMDAERLEFPSESFDDVLCGLALLFFPQPGLALAEMRRVLKPGGWVAVSTWDRKGDELWKWLEEDLYHAHMPPRPAADRAAAAPATPKVELDTVPGLAKAFQDAGFTAIQVKPVIVELSYRTMEDWWEALWSSSCRLMLEEIETVTGRDGLERFRQAVFAHLKTMQGEDGIHQIWPSLFCLARKPEE